MEITSLGVQVHGGMGFIEETGCAQHMRDARILPIYEGTNGIQSLDLVGRKITRDSGLAIGELFEEWSTTLSECRAIGDQLESISDSLETSMTACKAAVTALQAAAEDSGSTLGCASYNSLMLIGTSAVGALLAKSAVVAANMNSANEGNPNFNKQKITTATFYAQYVMPRNSAYLAAVIAGPTSIMALAEDDF